MINQAQIIRIISDLVEYVNTNECQHASTYRGGAIWTICNDCDRKWADDEGGFQPYQQPAEIKAAQALLQTLSAAPGAEDQQPTHSDTLLDECRQVASQQMTNPRLEEEATHAIDKWINSLSNVQMLALIKNMRK